jgi:hypothetical protein
MKLDMLTRRWDVYLKEGGSDYGTMNLQNLRPISTNTQLSESLRATSLIIPALLASIIMDSEKLHADIQAQLASDPVAKVHIGNTSDARWTQSDDGFIQHDGRIYVPDSVDLRLRILQYKHDHALSGHLGQNATLSLIRREYTWPRIRTSIIEFCKSCTTCMCSKSQRHKPYGFLKQLPILEQPWNSICGFH